MRHIQEMKFARQDICQISSSEVAVAMPDGVQFITVTQSHLKVIQSRFLKDHHQSQIGFQSSSGLSDMLSQEVFIHKDPYRRKFKLRGPCSPNPMRQVKLSC
ncbi:hypothetical protein DPMN_156986 [Dreissena polymorpha]|uniref:Uncharacterized protein n=1 Tax=Dreissena polymorpha TaxID=45954 RepID=A0A9D4JCB5_DREPO|nr:hypothetical protein DPMN_156986 [Dreissena polymorpha]